MILIPDNSTLLIIKEGNFDIKDITLRIMSNIQYTDLKITFDGTHYRKFINGMKIPEQYHNENQIYLKLKCKDLTGMPRVFPAEKLPVLAFTTLGERVEDLYPVAVKRAIDLYEGAMLKIAKLEDRVKELEEVGVL